MWSTSPDLRLTEMAYFPLSDEGRTTNEPEGLFCSSCAAFWRL